MNALLKFPVPEDSQRKTALAADLRPAPEIRSFSREDSRALLGVAQKVHRGTGILLDLVDSDRGAASQGGVETLAIELGSERKNVERILDALEDAETRQADASLTLDGLALLRRTEKLLAEAESNLSRFGDAAPAKALGQSASKSLDGLIWGSLFIVGVVVIGVVVMAAGSPGKK